MSVLAHDGSISVSAHAGTTHVYKNPEAIPGARDFLVGYFNQTLNWRSTDDGRTWEYIGLLGQREGPHSLTSTGFSDPDYAIDQAGNIYNTEIDLANVAVFKSPDDGQSYPIANPEAFSGDRPWLVALEEDEVFLYINSPRNLLRSTDGGLTWSLLPATALRSKPLPDPLNPDDGIIGPGAGNTAALSGDDGQTWQNLDFGPIGSSVSFFNAIAVDRAGNAYTAGAGGYTDSTNNPPNGEVSFGYHERATGRTNESQITIPTPEGDALWPWLVAGDEGRVAVVWYQTLGTENTRFYIFAAVTHNGVGTNFETGDRRLGDFFTVNFDKDGDVFIASADTMLKNPLGGPKPVGNPIVIRQISGDRLLEEPMDTRPTRCLWPLPSC